MTIKHHPTHLFLQTLQEHIVNAHLSGSLALQMQGYNTGKEAGDIDIYLEPSTEFKAEKVIKDAANAVWQKLDKDVFSRMVQLANVKEYLDDEFVRESFHFYYKTKVSDMLKSIKIDFFCSRAIDGSVDYLALNGSTSSYAIEDGEKFKIRTLNAIDIIKFKVQHAMNGEGHWSERKQQVDLVRFFANLI